jgi:hypothetical protein
MRVLNPATGQMDDDAGIKIDTSIFSQTPQKKADYYNSLLGQGYTDAAIRTAFGGVSETDPNWVALRQLAWGVKTPVPINRTYVSNFTPVQQPTLTVAEPPKIDWGPFEAAYKAMVERNGT